MTEKNQGIDGERIVIEKMHAHHGGHVYGL